GLPDRGRVVERGKAEYGQTLAEFFPAFPAYAKRVTIRHLLHHVAGFPEYDDLFLAAGMMDADFPRSAKTPRSRFEPTAKDALDILSRVPELRFAPGDRYEYSNSGYVLLAQIVERAAGQSFSRFLRENLFLPLGMERSLLYDETRPAVRNRATSYSWRDGAWAETDYAPQNAIYGEDNIYSTLDDLIAWDRALDTGNLVSSATLREAFTPGRLNDGSAVPYGYGWEIRDILGLRAVLHGGAWLGYRTFILRFPAQRFTVIILANLDRMPLEDLAVGIAKRGLEREMRFPVPVSLSREILIRYIGKYEIKPGHLVEVALEADGLWLRLPEGKRRKLVAESETTFFVEGSEEKRVVFTTDAGNAVRGFTAAGIRARKV
ncbi:MAG TPA: serine hydrolase, partial [Candidatus Ozemobacteraceae bacterium]|nr:serine hydrolase [Candidatus Ozemobacteraceae bacterium]